MDVSNLGKGGIHQISFTKLVQNFFINLQITDEKQDLGQSTTTGLVGYCKSTLGLNYLF